MSIEVVDEHRKFMAHNKMLFDVIKPSNEIKGGKKLFQLTLFAMMGTSVCVFFFIDCSERIACIVF